MLRCMASGYGRCVGLGLGEGRLGAGVRDGALSGGVRVWARGQGGLWGRGTLACSRAVSA